MIFAKRCTYRPGVSLVVTIPDTMDLLQDLAAGKLTKDEVFEETIDRIIFGEDVPQKVAANRDFRLWVFEQLHDITLDAMVYLGLQDN